MLKFLIRWIALAAVVASTLWALSDPKWESWAATAGAFVVFLGTFKRSPAEPGQHQHVEKASTGIQAGGNVTIGGDVGQKDH
jgi:hypothetical protein